MNNPSLYFFCFSNLIQQEREKNDPISITPLWLPTSLTIYAILLDN